MLQGKRTRRIIAATLLTIMLTNILAPTVTYALTSGPTQPEATSFEPVDTTDMINLQTGDLTYNIPLLEVPGPEGGYPLSLSYHAGIQPNEDASWVGLGWTLNPGAITRSVNGYPDDWYQPQQTRRDYWVGGQIKTYEVGLSIGIANSPATVSFGLSFSHDTYRGFGYGSYVGVGSGLPLSRNVGLNANVRVGITDFEGSYASGGIGIGLGIVGGKDGGLSGSVGVSFYTNFESLNTGFSGGINYSVTSAGHQENLGGSLLGASISTGNNKPSFSVGGLTASVGNSNAGNIRTKSSSFGIDIPIWYGINLSMGYSKVRYWTDETVSIYTHGSIHGTGWGVANDHAYDAYALLEEPGEKNLVDYPDPNMVQGGAYPDYDSYSVNAQGLGGNMRPYRFQGEILRQNIRYNGTPKVTYYSPGGSSGRSHFRFQSDFSNTYRQKYDPYNDPNLNLRYVEPPFDPGPVSGTKNYVDGGYVLAGSKYVDVNLRVKPYNIQGYNRSEKLFDGRMIEGYSITNESGVTYHFGLPAYSWDEESYQGRIDKDHSQGYSFNRIKRPSPYAYTWYLTTITGPDFVDRNNNEKADDGDWGYWINFEYGKWSNNYVWRNPSQGYIRDEDNQFQNCAMGRKEVYYLNAIRTRTHFALFEKDIRDDAKGESPAIFLKNSNSDGETDYKSEGMFDGNSSQSLKLSNIYLFNLEDTGWVKTNGGLEDAFRPGLPRTIPCSDCELAANVFDRTDIDITGRRSALTMRALRVINFVYDYSLCPNTSNSFYIDHPTGFGRSGKLTLKKLVMQGKNGNGMFPPIQFEYDISGEDVKTATGSLTASTFSTGNDVFQVGDLLCTSEYPYTYCGVVKGMSVEGGTTIYQLANSNYSGSSSNITVRTTKNPPYHKDFYDEWGYYKSDFNNYLTFGYNAQDLGNENLGRATGKIAAKAVDAWSLRKIVNPTGAEIKIQYESDSYRESVLNQNMSIIGKFTRLAGETYGDREYFIYMGDFVPAGYKPSYFFSPGDQVNLVGFQEGHFDGYTAGSEHPFQRAFGTTQFTNPIEVLEVRDNSWDCGLKVKLSTDFYNYLFSNRNGFYDEYNLPVSMTTSGFLFSLPATVNVSIANTRELYGGGIRVKALTVKKSADNTVYNTNYDYSHQGTSSGVTSYEPTVLDAMKITGTPSAYRNGNFVLFDHTRKAYARLLYNNLHRLYAIARELPPPGVMYEYVGISNDVKQPGETIARPIEGKVQYQFDVYRANMVDRELVGTQQGSNSLGVYYVKNLALKKFTGSIGNVKRITQYDKDGKKLSETINHYLHDGLEGFSFTDFMREYKLRLDDFAYQGYLQERYSEVKEVSNQTNSADNGVKATLSAREEYPCISTGQTVINYVNGTQTSSKNLAYDFYSGALTKSVETDAYGNRFMTEVKPAYQVDNYKSAMGLKLTGGRNMLTQTAATYMYKVDAGNNKLGLVSANVTTWSNETTTFYLNDYDPIIQNGLNNSGNVWRMKASYNWMPANKTYDGLTAMENFTDFNWSFPASAVASWKKTSEITLYNVYSKALETRDINNNFSAAHMNPLYLDRVQLTGSPANYYEIAYTGAEEKDEFMGYGLNIDEAFWSTDPATAHTGSNSFGAIGGQPGIYYTVNTDKLVAGRNYMVSAWIKPESGTDTDVKLYYKINDVEMGSVSSSTSNTTAGAWKFVSLVIKGQDIVPGKTLLVGWRNDHATTVYLDDFLFRPLNATTTAYIYDPFSGELTFMLDQNSVYTKFEYDGAGRLVKTYKEKLGIGSVLTSEYTYNYSSPKFTNAPIAGWFQKSDCAGDGRVAGSSYYLTVPGGMFTSYVSQGQADALASSSAQHNLNLRTICDFPSTIYARVSHSINLDYYNSCILQYSATATLRFYSDPEGYYPIKVSNLPINLIYHYESPDYNYTTTSTEICSGYSKVIATSVPWEYHDQCQNFSVYQYYSIGSGTGYTAIPE